MKALLIYKADSLLLSLASILYGYQLITKPQIFSIYSVYDSLESLVNPVILGWVLVGLGILKIIGVLIQKKPIRRFALYLLSFIYFFLFALWALNPIANTIWLLPFILAGLTVVIAVKEPG